MTRRRNSSNIGTVNAVSPWARLKIIPLPMSALRRGATDSTRTLSPAAAVRARPEFSHRAPVQLLGWGQPIEPNLAGRYRKRVAIRSWMASAAAFGSVAP